MACKYIVYPYLNQSEAGTAIFYVYSLYCKAENYRETSGFVHMYIVYGKHTLVGRVCRKDLFQCSLTPGYNWGELYPYLQWTE